MAIIDIVDMVLNPVFGWLLDIPALIAILFLSVVLGLVNTLLQKYMTNQAKMKRLKDDTKKYQKQLKVYQKEGKTDKMMELQKKLMPIQMQLMKESFRPLIVTMIPFLIIFFWLANHFAFLPVLPGEPFAVTAVFASGVAGEATLSVPEGFTIDEAVKQVTDERIVWTISGPEGVHSITMGYAGAEFTRDVLITTERSYIQPKMSLKGVVKEFNIGNKKLQPLGDGFNLFGWFPGWIFYYIILSIPISLLFKKILQVV